MRNLTSHLANSSGQFDLHKEMVSAAFESAAHTAEDLLQAEAIDPENPIIRSGSLEPMESLDSLAIPSDTEYAAITPSR